MEGYSTSKWGLRLGRFNGLLGSWYSVGRNFMVLRVDDSGNLVWGKAYGRSSSTNDEVAYSIKPTPDGGYIAVGFILWSFPDYDFLVLKISSTEACNGLRLTGEVGLIPLSMLL